MALLCAHLAGQSGGATRDDVRRRGRGRPAARHGHAAHRSGAARCRRAAERQPPQPGLRASADLVDARRPLRGLSEAGGPRHRRASRAARRLRLSARPRRRRDQPARPDRRPGRGRDGDVRRRAARSPSSASRCCCASTRAATTPATSPPCTACSRRCRRARPTPSDIARALDRAGCCAWPTSSSAGARPARRSAPASTARRRRCSAR